MAPASPRDVTADISQQAATLFNETANWISGNILGILIAAAIGTAIALALLAIRSIGCRIIRKSNESLHWRTIFARVLARTNLFFIVMTSAELVAEFANTPPGLFKIIHVLFVISVAFQAAIWLRELILGFVEHRIGPDTEHSSLSSAKGIIRLLVSVALFALALVLILDNLGVNVTGLIAGLGIGGIAIGLAAQGIFSDLFAALSIIFDKPFRRGDQIKFDTISGSVEQIGLKTTRIRSLIGEEIVISNANLLGKELHNFANLERRRIVLKLGLICQTPPDVCARIPELLKAIVESHKHSNVVRCGMVGFGDSTLDFELTFDVHSRDYDYVFATRSQICIGILDAFNKANIQLAYPTQTAFTAAPDGRLIMPYPITADDGSEHDGAGPDPADAHPEAGMPAKTASE
jgi:small-conductance mechanosensitive channel